MIEMSNEDPNTWQHSPEAQLGQLGLSLEDVLRINGKVLDVGCGADAYFVHYLRELGIDAEGTDPRVKGRAPFLIRKDITCSGAIPRDDGAYALVVSHMNSALYQATNIYLELLKEQVPGSNQRIDENHAFRKIIARVIILEALRVTDKSSGMFVCHPAIDGLAEELSDVVAEHGFQISKERIDRRGYVPLSPDREKIGAVMGYRTVFTPIS